MGLSVERNLHFKPSKLNEIAPEMFAVESTPGKATAPGHEGRC